MNCYAVGPEVTSAAGTNGSGGGCYFAFPPRLSGGGSCDFALATFQGNIRVFIPCMYMFRSLFRYTGESTRGNKYGKSSSRDTVSRIARRYASGEAPGHTSPSTSSFHALLSHSNK